MSGTATCTAVLAVASLTPSRWAIVRLAPPANCCVTIWVSAFMITPCRFDFREGGTRMQLSGCSEFTPRHKKAQKALCAFLWLTLFERLQTLAEGFEGEEGALETGGFDVAFESS